MGGDNSYAWIPSSEDESSPSQDFHQESPFSIDNDEGYSTKGDDGSSTKRLGLKEVIGLRQKRKVYAQVLKSYECETERLEKVKYDVLSYTPGSWRENVDDEVCDKRVVPKTTSLLLLGPKASGKSSLVNRICEVFEDCPLLARRAQVSSSQLTEDGTFFSYQYKVPRSQGSFCLYDTRSLSDDPSENLEDIERWMTDGVCHGELVLRDSDTKDLKARLKCKARHSYSAEEQMMINSVIFVVNGASVLEAMTSDNDTNRKYCQDIATNFNNPLLSFKDDKPVVVVTHGDLLSIPNRVKIRVYLGELLGIPPTTQIFDIPDNDDPASTFAIADMLSICLERSDSNLPVDDNEESGGSHCGLLLLCSIALVTVAYILLEIVQNGWRKAFLIPLVLLCLVLGAWLWKKNKTLICITTN